jgi:hypothetical protein
MFDTVMARLGKNPEPDEPDALVGATLKPKPHRGAGSIALPEPDEPNLADALPFHHPRY